MKKIAFIVILLATMLAVNLPVNARGIPILMFHHIAPLPETNVGNYISLWTTPQTFESKLKYLRNHNYHTISLMELYLWKHHKLKLPPNPIVLTADDGYSDIYTVAFPLLKKYHAKMTIFLITAYIGAKGHLSWPEIWTMKESGLIEIGSHTITHPNLVMLYSYSPKRCWEQIVNSKLYLEQNLHTRINFLSYPYGKYNKAIEKMVKKAGYLGAVSTEAGNNYPYTDEFGLRRWRVRSLPPKRITF